jgi:cytochrome c
MKPGAKVLVGLCLAGLILQPMPGWTQKTPEELYKETLAACAVSAKTRPSVEMIKEKVDKACDLLRKEGEAAFPKFKGTNSEFIFCGTYIWVHDLKGIMRLEPAIPMMEGVGLIDGKDEHNKRPFFEMNKVAKEKGAGWMDYWWPKPGESTPSRNLYYIKLCRVGGEDMVVGSGAYDLPDNQIDKFLQAQKKSNELAKETETAAAQHEPAVAIPKTASQLLEPKPAASPVRYVGSITSNKYHYPDCRWAKRILPEKVLCFRSVVEAKEKGYIRCPVCMPPLTDKPSSE